MQKPRRNRGYEKNIKTDPKKQYKECGLHSNVPGKSPVECSCDHSNKASSFAKGDECLGPNEQLEL